MERVITRRRLKCFSCHKITEHMIDRKNVGTKSFPVFRYKTTCLECKAVRYFPREPKNSTEMIDQSSR